MKEIERLSPKEAFLKSFEDHYQDEFLPKEWTTEQKARVEFLTSNTRTKTTMFTSIPMNCAGKDCMFADTCPLLRENIAPVGKPCAIELSMVKNFMADYMEQMHVDAENLVELSMIRDLVDLEVQYLRKTKLMAKESFIQEYVMGIDPEGDPIMGKQLHLAVEFEDRIHKKKQATFKVLLATRESQAKAGMAVLDSAQTMSGLVMSAQNILAAKERELKQRLGIIDEDEYIEAQVRES